MFDFADIGVIIHPRCWSFELMIVYMSRHNRLHALFAIISINRYKCYFVSMFL